MKPLNVLSLFNGISCGRLALERARIPVANYYESEIDPYAGKVSAYNWPQSVQIGDVKNVSVKVLLLSEAYAYICNKYFTDDSIHRLQGIISEREMLHRINEEQTMAACFGTQIQNETAEISKHTSLQINGSIWFFRNEMGDTKRVHDIIRGGERGDKINKGNARDLRQHSFWRDGNGQFEPGIKEKSIGGVARENRNARDKAEDTAGGNCTVFNAGITGIIKTERNKAVSRPNKKGQAFECFEKSGQGEGSNKEIENLRIEKTRYVLSAKNSVQDWDDQRDAKRDYGIERGVYQEIQATLVECEWGILIFKGVFSLILSGSPCQGFSYGGKQLNFSDPRSALFFEFVRILKECQAVNPKVLYMLENVPMKKEFQRVINEALGIMPVTINGALVSAQNRNRIFWTNIKTRRDGLFGDLVSDIPQPADKGILLKDILESDVDEKYFLSDTAMKRILSNMSYLHKKESFGVINNDGILSEVDQANCIDASYGKGMDNHGQRTLAVVVQKVDVNDLPKANQEKADCYTAGGNSAGNHSQMDLILQIPRGNNPGGERAMDGKTPCVNASRFEQNNFAKTKGRIRRLTPTEVCRLFNVPDGYFNDKDGKRLVSESQQYKAL